MALLWVLNLSDGTQTVLDMAARSQIDFDTLHYAAQRLCAVGLLDPA
jgi:aminopeptidase-like protein